VIRVAIARPAPSSPALFGAWVLDLIGCVSLGGSEEAALAGVRPAIEAYLRHARGLGLIAPRGDVDVVERFSGWWEGDYEVSAFFRQFDLAPVTPEDARYALALLERTGDALLSAARRARQDAAGDRDVDATLRHLAEVEWWYATRLDERPEDRAAAAAETRDVEDLLARSRAAVRRLVAGLPSFGTTVRGHNEEMWTARKVLRRVIFHELDHVLQLERRTAVGTG
jgi:uncharacterized damage-inducible protein DinB